MVSVSSSAVEPDDDIEAYHLASRSPGVGTCAPPRRARDLPLTVACYRCCAGSRVFVEQKIHEEFVSRMLKKMQKTKVGDPFEPGTTQSPQFSQEQLDYARRGSDEEDGGGIIILKNSFRL